MVDKYNIMRLDEVQTTAKTKAGTIRLVFQEDIERENRGFTIDKITAYLDGEDVGYLKLSYIPKEKFLQFFPSVFNFEAQMNGKSLLPYEKRTVHWKDLDMEEKKELLKRYFLYFGRRDRSDEIDRIPDNRVEPYIRNIEKKLVQNNRGRISNYISFFGYFVDKPFVDYIKVEKEYQRQGIGLVLYKAGAQWMKERGMKMYASGIQSADAQRAWEKLEQIMTVGKDKGRRYLEPNQGAIDEQRP